MIFTTPTGLRAVGADDGVDAWALPDGGGGLAPAGRGLLIGDLVLWPTASKGPGSPSVYAVRQRDGEQPDYPSLLSRIPAGNLVYADGCLLSADRQVLTIFTPPGKEGPSRSEKHTARMDAARQAVAAGRWEEAEEDFRQASSTSSAPRCVCKHCWTRRRCGKNRGGRIAPPRSGSASDARTSFAA